MELAAADGPTAETVPVKARGIGAATSMMVRECALHIKFILREEVEWGKSHVYVCFPFYVRPHLPLTFPPPPRLAALPTALWIWMDEGFTLRLLVPRCLLVLLPPPILLLLLKEW